MHGYIDNLAAGHLNIADVPNFGISNVPLTTGRPLLLVKEWLKDNDLVTRLDKGHKSTQHASRTN